MKEDQPPMTECVGFGIIYNIQHPEAEEEVTSCIPYNQSGSSGPINAWTLCRLVDDGKTHSGFTNFCHGLELMNEGGKFVPFSAYFVFDKKQIRDVNRITYFPYKVVTRVHEVDQPSVKTIHSLINMVNGKTVVRCFSENILVDIRSRRQKLLPYWFVNDYKHFKGALSDNSFAKQATLSYLPLPEVPLSPPPLGLSLQVTESETDANKVLHKDALIRYTFECVDFACRQKRFPYLGSCLGDVHLSQLAVCYHSDAFSGDHLTVLCWQEERPDSLWCCVKKSTTIIFTAHMTFDLGN